MFDKKLFIVFIAVISIVLSTPARNYRRHSDYHEIPKDLLQKNEVENEENQGYNLQYEEENINPHIKNEDKVFNQNYNGEYYEERQHQEQNLHEPLRNEDYPVDNYNTHENYLSNYREEKVLLPHSDPNLLIEESKVETQHPKVEADQTRKEETHQTNPVRKISSSNHSHDHQKNEERNKNNNHDNKNTTNVNDNSQKIVTQSKEFYEEYEKKTQEMNEKHIDVKKTEEKLENKTNLEHEELHQNHEERGKATVLRNERTTDHLDELQDPTQLVKKFREKLKKARNNYEETEAENRRRLLVPNLFSYDSKDQLLPKLPQSKPALTSFSIPESRNEKNIIKQTEKAKQSIVDNLRNKLVSSGTQSNTDLTDSSSNTSEENQNNKPMPKTNPVKPPAQFEELPKDHKNEDINELLHVRDEINKIRDIMQLLKEHELKKTFGPDRNLTDSEKEELDKFIKKLQKDGKLSSNFSQTNRLQFPNTTKLVKDINHLKTSLNKFAKQIGSHHVNNESTLQKIEEQLIKQRDDIQKLKNQVEEMLPPSVFPSKDDKTHIIKSPNQEKNNLFQELQNLKEVLDELLTKEDQLISTINKLSRDKTERTNQNENLDTLMKTVKSISHPSLDNKESILSKLNHIEEEIKAIDLENQIKTLKTSSLGTINEDLSDKIQNLEDLIKKNLDNPQTRHLPNVNEDIEKQLHHLQEEINKLHNQKNSDVLAPRQLQGLLSDILSSDNNQSSEKIPFRQFVNPSDPDTASKSNFKSNSQTPIIQIPFCLQRTLSNYQPYYNSPVARPAILETSSYQVEPIKYNHPGEGYYQPQPQIYESVVKPIYRGYQPPLQQYSHSYQPAAVPESRPIYLSPTPPKQGYQSNYSPLKHQIPYRLYQPYKKENPQSHQVNYELKNNGHQFQVPKLKYPQNHEPQKYQSVIEDYPEYGQLQNQANKYQPNNYKIQPIQGNSPNYEQSNVYKPPPTFDFPSQTYPPVQEDSPNYGQPQNPIYKYQPNDYNIPQTYKVPNQEPKSYQPMQENTQNYGQLDEPSTTYQPQKVNSPKNQYGPTTQEQKKPQLENNYQQVHPIRIPQAGTYERKSEDNLQNKDKSKTKAKQAYQPDNYENPQEIVPVNIEKQEFSTQHQFKNKEPNNYETTQDSEPSIENQSYKPEKQENSKNEEYYEEEKQKKYTSKEVSKTKPENITPYQYSKSKIPKIYPSMYHSIRPVAHPVQIIPKPEGYEEVIPTYHQKVPIYGHDTKEMEEEIKKLTGMLKLLNEKVDYHQDYGKELDGVYRSKAEEPKKKRSKRSYAENVDKEELLKDIHVRLNNLRSQVLKNVNAQNNSLESSYETPDNEEPRSAYSPYSSYQPYSYNKLSFKKRQKFDDLFIKIVKFILHKLEISAPLVVESLFNGEAYIYDNDYNNGEYESNYRQNARSSETPDDYDPFLEENFENNDDTYGYRPPNTPRNFGGLFSNLQGVFPGLLGFIPTILFKLLSNFSSFLNILKRNNFFKNFLFPGALILVVDGIMGLLVWWFSSTDDDQNFLNFNTNSNQALTSVSSNNNYVNRY